MLEYLPNLILIAPSSSITIVKPSTGNAPKISSVIPEPVCFALHSVEVGAARFVANVRPEARIGPQSASLILLAAGSA